MNPELLRNLWLEASPIRLALIDSGFRPGRPDAVPENRVYQFCQKHSRFCRPTKGRDTQVKPVMPRKSEVGVDIRGFEESQIRDAGSPLLPREGAE